MALRAIEQDIDLMRGDDYPWEFQTNDPDGAAYVMTGSTVTMTIKDKIDGNILWQGNSTTGTVLATGLLFFVIPDTYSETIQKDCFYDVQETTSGSLKQTLWFGKVLLKKDVNS